MRIEDEYTEDSEVEASVGTALDLLSGTEALSAVDRAALDVQIATAKTYPRSVDRALKEALTLATMDEETAGSMFYALPRSGKTIEGPSARLAEIMAYSWGNLRADADIVAEDATHITAMGTCFDLEKNVAVRVRVKRRITDKRGGRYNDDMIGVTGNAAISIALRNAVLKVIPRTFSNRIYQEARTASLGKGGTVTQKRQNALAWFAKMGVQEHQVFDLLRVRGLDDIGEDHLITLRGLKTAIQDGETTVEATFNPPKARTDGAGKLNAALEDSPPEDDDGKPPAKSQIAQLQDLMDKTPDGYPYEDLEAAQLAIDEKDGPGVRKAIREINRALAAGQGDLLDGKD